MAYSNLGGPETERARLQPGPACTQKVLPVNDSPPLAGPYLQKNVQNLSKQCHLQETKMFKHMSP